MRERGALTTFVLIPGAGGQVWFWHRLVGQHRTGCGCAGVRRAAGARSREPRRPVAAVQRELSTHTVDGLSIVDVDQLTVSEALQRLASPAINRRHRE